MCFTYPALPCPEASSGGTRYIRLYHQPDILGVVLLGNKKNLHQKFIQNLKL